MTTSRPLRYLTQSAAVLTPPLPVVAQHSHFDKMSQHFSPSTIKTVSSVTVYFNFSETLFLWISSGFYKVGDVSAKHRLPFNDSHE
jgi:hypothetical protein